MTFARVPRTMRAALSAAVSAALLAALAACSSPPSHFYTLSAGDQPADAARTASNPAFLIEVPPVDVPPQVAKNQLVVQTGPTQVQVLEQERWASLPGDEIRRALSSSLTQQLGTIDVYGSPYPDRVPVYRVSVNVQRFESWPGSRTLIDAVWSVRAVRTQAVLTCRSVVTEPVSGGYDAIAVGHRRAVQQISTEVAVAVRNLAAAPARGAAVTCPASATGPAAAPGAASASSAANKG
ncbi:PqiC family protein [Paraburkholderia azotifigens]|uniref:Membrane integrity-associated transporter subunit PqiC n=1 Tax=Paraburkholderia azotifigens TaxID=2057004 RepID=A0A5C6VT43_9BURK|nr:PqiC family protein [Paraburkholderia azotifigens]TXC88662.1 membrane integrity-associated transporter subunit PqiC [Paraburkholderia azotifigens]